MSSPTSSAHMDLAALMADLATRLSVGTEFLGHQTEEAFMSFVARELILKGLPLELVRCRVRVSDGNLLGEDAFLQGQATTPHDGQTFALSMDGLFALDGPITRQKMAARAHEIALRGQGFINPSPPSYAWKTLSSDPFNPKISLGPSKNAQIEQVISDHVAMWGAARAQPRYPGGNRSQGPDQALVG